MGGTGYTIEPPDKNSGFTIEPPDKSSAVLSKPPERPGYFRRFGRSFGIPTSTEELKGALPPVPKSLSEGAMQAFEAGVDPMGLVKGAGNYLRTAGEGLKRGFQESKEAGTNIGEGGPILPNVGKAASGVMEAATSALPVVGSTLRTAGEDWFNKNYRGALGGMTGTVLQLMGLREGEEKGSDIGKADPERAVGEIAKGLDTPGGKGGVRATKMIGDLNDAKADLADISRNTPLRAKGAARFHELAEKISEKQDRIWDEGHKPQVQRFHDQPVNHEWIANETAKSLPPETEDAAPEETAKASKWIETTLNKPRTLQQLDNLLRDINNDIKGKNYEAYGPKGIKVRQDAAKAIRTEIDRVLMQNGESGVRSINRRWGALDNIKTRAQEIAVQQARLESKQGALPDWVKPYVFLHPDWGTLTGISANLSKLRKSPAGRLGSGMKELRRTGLESPPNPPFRLVPPSGRGIGPEQAGLPGATSPLEPNFSPRGRVDVSFPGKKAQGSSKGFAGSQGRTSFREATKPVAGFEWKVGDTLVDKGITYVFDGEKWVRKTALSPVPKLRSGQ